MRALASFRRLLLITCALLLSTAAQAQSFRAYLSSAGNDANPCTLVSPCRLLPAAITAVASGGEIWMVDSANFNSGPVNINKTVTIMAIPGAVGSLVALGGNAVNITTAVNVTMRNLVIVPYVGGVGQSGIVMTAGSLTLENSVVANLSGQGHGIIATNARLVVSSSSVRNNQGIGIALYAGASAIITGSTVTGNIYGVSVEGGTSGTTTADITASTLSGNGGPGLLAFAPGGGSVKVSMRDGQLSKNSVGAYSLSYNGAVSVLSLTNVTASNNTQAGVYTSNQGASITLSATTVTGNTTGVYQENSAVIESGADNIVRSNGTNVIGTLTPITKL